MSATCSASTRGLRCLADDDRLVAAFRDANETFRRSGAARKTPITTWRLFQVVYQVIQLAALRAREADDPELLAELDRVDVLWFPTGGGKTEAYLGLIIDAALLRPPARQGARRHRDPALPAADALRPAAAAHPRRAVVRRARSPRARRRRDGRGGDYTGDEFLPRLLGRARQQPRTPRRTATHAMRETTSTGGPTSLRTSRGGDERRDHHPLPQPGLQGRRRRARRRRRAGPAQHVCRTCGEELPVSSATTRSTATCRQCSSARSTSWRTSRAPSSSST